MVHTLVFVIVSLALCLAIAYFLDSKYRKQLFDYIRDNLAGTILFILGIFILIGGFTYLYDGNWKFVKLVEDFYANFGAEFVSIAITVLIIDYLNRKRQETQLKAQLIREMGGPDNGFALRAARELAHHRWLCDGSLRGANLGGANLAEGAILTKADLSYTNLSSANLIGAFMPRAILEEANLMNAKLCGVTLSEANLKKANLIGADFLEADLRGVNLKGANLVGAKLVGAVYDQHTVWPDGFDPDEAGARLID